MKKILMITAFVLAAGAFVACNNDDDGTKETPVIPYVLNLNLPATLDNANFTDVEILFTNVNTGKETKMAFTNISGTRSVNGGEFQMEVPEGIYNIAINAGIQYYINNTATNCRVRSTRDNVTVAASASGAAPSLSIELVYFNSGQGFVIEEIFFTGTLKPDGAQYTGDKYFKITNNSDELLYADGIAILESLFLTTSKYDYTPDIMSSAFAVGAVYVIPGDGDDVPVEPGKSLIICDIGTDHRTDNPNSIDLSKADFEWVDESTMDPDSPSVPNLDKWYSYSATIWGPHNRGFRSYAIAKMEVTKEEYLANYAYTGNYIFEFNGTKYEMSAKGYQVPNTWIVDAVNLSVEAAFEWVVTDPSLDMGWSYCGKTTADANRYGKAVRRKVENTVNGRNYLKDSNNSTKDFDAEVTPSLLN